MTNPVTIKEVVPKAGLLFQEITLHPVLCKPKIMPLKSVTMEKLEKMQKDAQEKAIEMERKQERPTTGVARAKTSTGKTEPAEGPLKESDDSARPMTATKSPKADVWRADDDDEGEAV